jgi:Ricin-type beta-trefoil lectin domain-like
LSTPPVRSHHRRLAMLVAASFAVTLALFTGPVQAAYAQPPYPCDKDHVGRIGLDDKGQAWICAELKDEKGNVTGYQWLRLTKNRRRSRLINVLANLALEVQNDDDRAGRQLVLRPRRNTAWQEWTWGGGAAGTVNVLANGECMGVLGGTSKVGEHIVQWPCNGHPDQSWYAVQVNPDDSSPNPETRLVNANSWMCAGVVGNSTTPGSYLVQWPCNASRDKIWLGG